MAEPLAVLPAGPPDAALRGYIPIPSLLQEHPTPARPLSLASECFRPSARYYTGRFVPATFEVDGRPAGRVSVDWSSAVAAWLASRDGRWRLAAGRDQWDLHIRAPYAAISALFAHSASWSIAAAYRGQFAAAASYDSTDTSWRGLPLPGADAATASSDYRADRWAVAFGWPGRPWGWEVTLSRNEYDGGLRCRILAGGPICAAWLDGDHRKLTASLWRRRGHTCDYVWLSGSRASQIGLAFVGFVPLATAEGKWRDIHAAIGRLHRTSSRRLIAACMEFQRGLATGGAWQTSFVNGGQPYGFGSFQWTGGSVKFVRRRPVWGNSDLITGLALTYIDATAAAALPSAAGSGLTRKGMDATLSVVALTGGLAYSGRRWRAGMVGTWYFATASRESWEYPPPPPGPPGPRRAPTKFREAYNIGATVEFDF